MLRVARRKPVAESYRFEERLLPELAPLLPLEVPAVVRRRSSWIVTRYVRGSAFDGSADLRPLGDFLRALHAFPVEWARALGAGEHDPGRDAERFGERVLPLLDEHERDSAEALLDEHAAARFEPRLTHADLGPEHVLVRDGRLAGVIDWTDARLGDPAIDLAWALQAAPQLAETYPVDASLARRALVYHALGPWHEVDWGVRWGKRRWIESGLAGLRARLPKVAGRPDTMSE